MLDYKGDVVLIKRLGFRSRVVYEKSKTALTEKQKDYIDKFEEGL